MIQWIETFIIMNPWETVTVLSLICVFAGMYIEDVFKIWNWGPQCAKCNEWGFWDTSKSYCNECDEHRSNDIWHDGYVHGERDTGGLR